MHLFDYMYVYVYVGFGGRMNVAALESSRVFECVLKCMQIYVWVYLVVGVYVGMKVYL